MARAYGSSAHLLMKRETVYGQAATGNYIRMPFNRCNLGSEQGLIDDPVLGQGRDPLAPLQDVINDEGDIVLPVDPRYLGLWLTGLFGDPDARAWRPSWSPSRTGAARTERARVGIETDAALKIGAARGFDLAVLSELLPAAEAGVRWRRCDERVGSSPITRQSRTSGRTMAAPSPGQNTRTRNRESPRKRETWTQRAKKTSPAVNWITEICVHFG